MKKKFYVSLFLISVFVVVGCASKQLWRSKPNMQHASNEYFDATISPIFTFNGYKGFILYIHNKTPQNLVLDWNKTFYLYNGKKEGDFWFKDIPYGEKKKSRKSDIISGSMFSKEIFPNSLLYLSTIAGTWVHDAMEEGENGVLLTVKVNGKEVTETLTLYFIKSKSD
jgi:hypothetical protein